MAKSSKYVKFSFPISAYQPDALQAGYSEKQLRQEYARLRDVAEKRLKRLEASEFAHTKTVQYNAGRFIPTRAVSGKAELSHLLSDIAGFLTAELSSVSGQKAYRRKSVETLREGGLTGITERNFKAMTDVLEWASAFKEYDPSELVRMVDAYAEKGISPNKFLSNLEELYQAWMQDHEPIPEGKWDE